MPLRHLAIVATVLSVLAAGVRPVGAQALAYEGDEELRRLVARADSLADAAEHEAAIPLYGVVARAFDLGAGPDAGGAELTAEQRRDLADSAAYYRFQQAGSYTQLWRGPDGERIMRDSLAPIVERGSDYARGLLAYMETEVHWVNNDWKALAEPAYRAIALLSRFPDKGPGYVAQTQQKLAFTYMAENPDSARYYAALSLRTLQDRYEPCSDWLGHGYNTAGTVYSYTGDVTGSVELYRLGRNVYEVALGPRHRITALADKNLGQSFFELSDLASALEHLERAIDVLEEGPPDYYYSSACEYYGLVLGHLGDHEGARRWVERALEVDRALSEDGGNDAILNATWRQVAIFAFDADDRERALAALDSADAARERFVAAVEGETDFTMESGHMRAMMLVTEAERRRALGEDPDYGPILELFDEAFARMTRDTIYNYVPEARLCQGVALVRSGQTARGLGIARSAVDRLVRRSGATHHAYAEALATLAELFAESGARDSARVYATRALESAGIAADSTEAPPIALATGEIARIYLEAYGLDTAAAPEAPYDAGAVAEFVLDHLAREAAQLPRLRYRPDELAEVRTVMIAAARAAGRRYRAGGEGADLARARAYLAVPRAMTLRRRTSAAAAARAVALPAELRARDHDLRLRLAAARALPDTHPTRAEALRTADVALVNHEFELRRDYPAYYHSVRAPLGRPPEATELPDGHARVRYLLDAPRGVALASVEAAASTPLGGGLEGALLELPYDSTLAAAVDRIVAAQADPRTPYPLAAASAVYAALVEPLGLDLGGRTTHLTIAADGNLLGLSFAALPTTVSPARADLEGVAWLGLSTAIAYEDAPAAPAAERARGGRPAGGILAVAPVFDEALERELQARGLDVAAAELPTRTPWSAGLAEDLAATYGADLLLRAEATPVAVRQRFGDYGVLHFATHAVLDADDPAASYFAFAPPPDSGDGRLHAYELYDALVPARLAVLPNCHSGAGEVVPGDGVYSLATGLRYAGCAAVVQSLWAVDDERTSALLAEVYAALAAGERIDAALRAARRTYLAAAPPEARHPYYWAGLTVVGDAGPVTLEHGGAPWWLLGFGGAALALGGVALARRSTR